MSFPVYGVKTKCGSLAALLPDKPNKWYWLVDLIGLILNSTVLAEADKASV